MIKRALDVIISAPLTILTAPLVALLAVAVRIESRGDAIYRQVRVGQDGRLFEIYKLRTMVSGAEFTGAGLAIAIPVGLLCSNEGNCGSSTAAAAVAVAGLGAAGAGIGAIPGNRTVYRAAK